MTDYDFSWLDESGVTQGEFAQLTGATRGTVSNWVHGKSKPTSAYRKIVGKYLALLHQAIRLGYLPSDLPSVYKANMPARKKYIRDALKATVEEIRKRRDN
mgnify:CR=1 FL=1